MPVPHKTKKAFDESLILRDVIPEEGKKEVGGIVEETVTEPVVESPEDNKGGLSPVVKEVKSDDGKKVSKKKAASSSVGADRESGSWGRFRRENTEECHFFVDSGNLELARFLSVKRRVSLTVTLNNALQFYLDNHPDAEFLKKLK